MTDTLSLFDQPAAPGPRLPSARRLIKAQRTRDIADYTPTARVTDPDTSHEAARLAGQTAGSLRRQCLEALAAGPLTDFELADQVGRQQTSAGKRRGELVAAGFVEATAERRRTPSGARAIVWQITPEGRAHLVAR